MSKTMTIYVNGEPEQRKVSHEERNPVTLVFQDVPVLQAGENMTRDSNGVVRVTRGAYK